ncbi:MAG: protein kinase family protein [bacterium]|nr:hypothetical protein [Gammaproteobacteria bacterium]HIL96512.1 hypothetical protein [Pseudomonadales bacterium]
MAVTLGEGQTISAKYSLLHRIAENDFVDCWLAIDTELNERVFLKVFKQGLTPEAADSISRSIDRHRGLLHEKINRTFGLEQIDNTSFIVSQYLQAAQSFSHVGDFKVQWKQLTQVANALTFAHSLGFAHGHLHPNNILVNAEENVSLTDFGTAHSTAGQTVSYLSPQIRSNHPVDASDDIYSFGQLLFTSLTGQTWREGQEFESDLPIPLEFQQLLTSMLHQSPYDRPLDIATIVEIVDGYAAGANNTIDVVATGFNRATPAPAEISPEVTHRLPRDRVTVSTNTAVIGLGLLVIVALIVFIFAPVSEPVSPITSIDVTNISKPHQTSTTTEAEPEPEPVLAPLEVARLKKLQQEGSETATELLRLQINVEDAGGQIWASNEYKQAVSLGLAGDDAFRYEDFQLALDKYSEGISVLNAVLDNVDAVFSENLETGNRALEDGNADRALDAFTILSAIRRSDPQVAAGLERAVNLKEVLGLVRDGEVIERNGDLKEALAYFQQAVRIDKLWHPATEAVTRVKRTIANNAFNDQMSIAYDALGDKDYEQARLAFDRAQRILPNSSAPEGGLQEIVISETQDKITVHKNLAVQNIQGEAWQEAISQYEDILSLSPGTIYAVEALKLARSRAALEQELQRYIEKPGLMITDDELDRATAGLLKAARIKDSGPKLQRQLNRLSHLISLARIPIDIELKSDNKTDVTVFKIGSFGKFDSKHLELYPGTYTIVGKRRKYRDIHQEITLLGGQPAPAILISCVEKVN